MLFVVISSPENWNCPSFQIKYGVLKEINDEYAKNKSTVIPNVYMYLLINRNLPICQFCQHKELLEIHST
jgi:hypothetical protein